MKRSAWDHPKLCDLEAQLNLPRYAAVGLLESLWQFTGRFAPYGDIGRFSDQAIARFIGWDRDAAALIDALVATHWLDRDAAGRLVVHDWNEHADQATRRHMERSGKPLKSGQAGRPSAGTATISRFRPDTISTISGPPEPEPEPEPVKKESSRKRPTLSAVADPPVPPNGHDPDHGTPDDLAAAWNATLHPPLPAVRVPLNPARLKAARLRLKEHPDSDYWHEVFRAIRASPFCLGSNDRGWRANFDWLLRPGSADKALEGHYQNTQKPTVLQRYV